MTDKNIYTETVVGDAEFSYPRFFLEIDGDNYVIGMYVAINEVEYRDYLSRDLIEVSDEIYISVGPSCQLINGKVVQGIPRPPVLDTDAKRAVLAARLRTATEQISVLQDAVELGIATEEEKINLEKWKNYRVVLNRLSVNSSDDIEWPTTP